MSFSIGAGGGGFGGGGYGGFGGYGGQSGYGWGRGGYGIGGYFGFSTSSEEPREVVMAFDSTAVILIEFTDHSDPANNFHVDRILVGIFNRDVHKA